MRSRSQKRQARTDEIRPGGGSGGGPAGAQGETPPPARSRRVLAVRLGPPVAGLVAMGASLLPEGAFPRVVPVVLFLLAGPGTAVLRLCYPRLSRHHAVGPVESWDTGFRRDSARIEQVMLAVFLSISITVLIATAMLTAEIFSGIGLLALLTALTTAAACCPPLAAGKHRSQRAPAPPGSTEPQKG